MTGLGAQTPLRWTYTLEPLLKHAVYKSVYNFCRFTGSPKLIAVLGKPMASKLRTSVEGDVRPGSWSGDLLEEPGLGQTRKDRWRVHGRDGIVKCREERPCGGSEPNPHGPQFKPCL